MGEAFRDTCAKRNVLQSRPPVPRDMRQNTKNKLEALRDLKKRNSVPTCRFWFFRILSLMKLDDGVLKLRRVRRRGKPLVEEPYIETSADRNEQYRCKVKRAHPFRSATSDVAQANCCFVLKQFHVLVVS